MQNNTGDWFAMTGSLQVTEAHDVAYDNLSNTFITGNQDTGTTYQPGENESLWISLSTADGGDVMVDTVSRAASNQSVRYSSFQNLGAFRQTVWDSFRNTAGTPEHPAGHAILEPIRNFGRLARRRPGSPSLKVHDPSLRLLGKKGNR